MRSAQPSNSVKQKQAATRGQSPPAVALTIRQSTDTRTSGRPGSEKGFCASPPGPGACPPLSVGSNDAACLAQRALLMHSVGVAILVRKRTPPPPFGGKVLKNGGETVPLLVGWLVVRANYP